MDVQERTLTAVPRTHGRGGTLQTHGRAPRARERHALGHSDSKPQQFAQRDPYPFTDLERHSDSDVERLLTDGLTIQAYDLPHTSFYLQPMGPVVVDPYVMYRDFLNRAIGAGVRLTFVWTMVPLTQTLTWGSVYGGVTPTTGQSPGSIYVGAIGGGVWAGAPGV